MLSPDSRSRMWDAGANGYARGEGVASVVLKTLSKAIADGDNIECIIRETGVNQDGRTPGITMPSSTAQAALIRSTYAKAGLDLKKKSDRCQYFEAQCVFSPLLIGAMLNLSQRHRDQGWRSTRSWSDLQGILC